MIFNYKVPLAAAIALSATAFAGPDLDTRVQNLEKEMKQVRTETASGTFGANTASARPSVEGHGFKLMFDVIYMEAKVGGSEYCYTDDDANLGAHLKGRTREADFDWDWGFRVGVGYNFDHGHWDALAQYTYYKSNPSATTTAGFNGSVVPLRGSSTIGDPNPFTVCDKATSEYSFDFDRLNLELGRNYYVSRDLSFRPHMGLTSAWMNLKQKTRYTGGADLGGNTVHVNDKSDFWGLGPRFGVNSKWHLTNGFSVFGNVSGALTYGYFTVAHKEWNSSNPADHYIRLTANHHRYVPTAQMVLGLSFDQYIYNDKQHVSVSLGWDVQYWWRVNQMLKIDDTSNNTLKYERYAEDANIHGATLNICWDF